MRILILGGTTEASALSALLAADARFAPTLSLAGRTRSPRLPAIPCRIGGFGGAAGLQRWLIEQNIAAVIDATHPYAARISVNAVAAAAGANVPLGSLLRPSWRPVAGDDWREVAAPFDAAAAIGAAPRRVFLSVGRLELPAFRAAPQHHYLARTIDPIDDAQLPPDLTVIHGRGPFAIDDEMQLLQQHAITVVVSKNSGGTATYAKIAAARRLGLPVVMIARPDKPAGHALTDAEDAMRWLVMLHGAHSGSSSLRGVSCSLRGV